MLTPKEWKMFQPVDNAKLIAESIRQIPSSWSLTPLQDKAPKRKDWQTEPFIPHEVIASLITQGEQATSKRTGKTYKRYWSGFGLRTGEASDGLLAIDVDGASAQLLLEKISGGNIPHTVCHTSGKPGRYQLILQVPADIRPQLQGFTRRVLTSWQGLETVKDEAGRPCELLEFRYNRCQSVLPPSRHPETGSYQWINSPTDTEVATAPDWLLNLLLDFAAEEGRHIVETSQRLQQAEKRRQERKLTPVSSNNSNLSDILDLSLSRLKPEDIFSWSGHNWTVQGRDEWAGYCPRHDSKSGSSFKLNSNTLEWYCFACEAGGHAAQYRHFVNGGNGTPKGKDFAEIVKGLASDAGVSFEKANPHEYIPIPGSGTKFRIKRGKDDSETFLASFPALAEKDGQEWLKLREFTPDETIDSEYFYYDPPGEGEGLAVQSGLGTGKSYYTNEFYVGEDDGAIFLGNRNTTISQFVENGKERHNRTWYLIQQDLREGGRDDLRLIQDPQSKIISCIDSILYIQPQDAVGKKAVFDEVESTLKHLNYSTTAVSYRRQHCKQRFAEITTEAHSTLLCDGNLKNITVRYVDRLSDKKHKKVRNIFKGNRGKITYYVGSEKFKKDEETNKWESVERRLNDYSLLLTTMMEDPGRFIVGADSQEQLETWDTQLKAKGRITFRLDSTTSNTVEGQKCIRNPAKYIKENGIDVLLYSPSADQGLSIDLKDYFKRGYFFFFGVVLTDTQIQFLGRLRDAGCHLHVYCQVKHKDANSANNGLLSEELQRTYVEYAKDCASISLLDVDEETRSRKLIELAHKLAEKSNDIHYEYECQLLAMAHFEQNNLRNCLEYAMREAGWQVEVVTGHKVSTNELNEIKALIRTERSEKILAAARLTASEAQNIERSGIQKEEDKPKLARHKLVERLPGIENKLIIEKKIVRVPASELATEKDAQNQAPSEAESTTEQGLEGVHIDPGIGTKYEGLCGQGGVSEEPPANLTPPTPENQLTQELEGVHIPSGGSIQNEGLCGQGEVVDFVEVEQEVTRPLFDADFIKRVKFQDRQLISRLESQFFLRNPHLAKLTQQRKWHKKLALFQDENQLDGVKRINLTTYKSPWLKINTLLEMGISYFMQPESSWTQETPEAISFWERGKDLRTARRIGIEVGDSDPCKYIGRVMDSYGLKREGKKITLPTGERLRQYHPKPLDPICQAIYDCVEARILALTSADETVLNWAEILEKTPSPVAESLPQQGLDLVHIPPDKSIHHEVLCGQETALVPLQKSEQDQLIDILAAVKTVEEFAAIAQNHSQETLETAICYQEEVNQKHRLMYWDKNLSRPVVEAVEVEVDESDSIPKSFTAGQQLKALRYTFAGKIAKVTKSFGDWCESTLGDITMSEVELGTWSFI